jgi:hypothetical protein
MIRDAKMFCDYCEGLIYPLFACVVVEIGTNKVRHFHCYCLNKKLDSSAKPAVEMISPQTDTPQPKSQ